LAESALLILMESRLFDASMADDSQKLYLDPKSITLVIKVRQMPPTFSPLCLPF
jgi:hypothetical protein